MMAKHLRLDLLGILNEELAMYRLQDAVITHLATRLGIERCLVENDHPGIAGSELIHGNTITIQGDNIGFERHVVIALKSGLRAIIGQRRGHLEFASRTRLLTLTGHG